MQGCASTGLAASVYENFDTAHGLFKIPIVTDEEELDFESDFVCDLQRYPQRRELLNKTDLFIWDEISSQHRREFDAVYKAMNKFKNKILILIGDKAQIAPVVVNGSRSQIVNASIYSSEYMDYVFKKIYFGQNQRLLGAEQEEINYAKLLLQLGSGHSFDKPPYYDVTLTESEIPLEDKLIGKTRIAISNQRSFVAGQQDEAAMQWLHPDGFIPNDMHRATILAGNNILLLL